MAKTPIIREDELAVFRMDCKMPFESKGRAKSQQAILHKARIAAEKVGYMGLRERMLVLRPARPEERCFGPETWIVESTNTRKSWERTMKAMKELKEHEAKMKGRMQGRDEGEGTYTGWGETEVPSEEALARLREKTTQTVKNQGGKK